MFAKVNKILSLSQQRAAEGHLGAAYQLMEMAMLRVLRGVGPGYYHTAGFWRRELSWRDKSSHLSATEYRRVVTSLNPPEYRKLSQNKIAEKAILSLFALPTPRFLGRLAFHNGLDHRGRSLRDAAELAALVREQGASRLVFKQIEGYGGKGVKIARLESRDEILCGAIGGTHSDTLQSLPDYCESELALSQGNDWLVEEYFDQHPVMAQLNPTSVNTVRIWILERSPSESVVVTAYVRIGRANMFVDNASSGGIVARIDLATGTLGAAQDAFADRRLYPRHPDHAAMIEGTAVPHWQEVQGFAKRVLSVFPNLRFAGLDIAIGKDGPVVLELNVSPDREAAAFTDCPTVPWLKATTSAL
jgi:Sugar-transfer associated ATP-grasp